MTTPNKITIHWSAGGYYPNNTDLKDYHFCVDKDGRVFDGRFRPEDNNNCQDGKYAAHTGGGNTGNIGIAVCAMAGYKSPKAVGSYPITGVQFEACMQKTAELCIKYGIPVTPETVFTHYEFGLKHSKTSSAGKIDITFIPSYPYVSASECGSFIRSKVKWYIEKIKKEQSK